MNAMCTDGFYSVSEQLVWNCNVTCKLLHSEQLKGAFEEQHMKSIVPLALSCPTDFLFFAECSQLCSGNIVLISCQVISDVHGSRGESPVHRTFCCVHH